jgi:hypothetical protein
MSVDVLVDLDPAVYACGFAAQSSEYHLVVEDKEGNLGEYHFKSDADTGSGDKMKEFIKWLPEGSNVLDKQKSVSAEPLSHALHLAKNHLDTLYRDVLALPVVGGHDVRFRGFLSGSNNYRTKLATVVPYKGNRDESSRPVHYDALRDYIRQYWDCVISQSEEADDLVSIAANQLLRDGDNYLVVSIDKDLDQIPGCHYNPSRKVFYLQGNDSAKLYFYQQALSGDATDNVPGCYKVGPTKAEAFIQAITEDYETISESCELAIWASIEEAYVASCQRVGCPYTSLDAARVALETGRLVYIQKQSNELWNPPGVPFERIL